MKHNTIMAMLLFVATIVLFVYLEGAICLFELLSRALIPPWPWLIAPV